MYLFLSFRGFNVSLVATDRNALPGVCENVGLSNSFEIIVSVLSP